MIKSTYLARFLIFISLLFIVFEGCDVVEEMNPFTSKADGHPHASGGRSLEIHTEKPIMVDHAYYEDGVDNYFIEPTASNKQLVVLDIVVVNRSSTIIPLLIEPNSVKLGDRRGLRIEALNPYEVATKITDEFANETNPHYVTQIIWGEIELPRDTQVAGTIIFEVPKSLLLGTLFWDEVEYIPIDYIDYQEN